jgi:hypothetical protein
LVHKRGQNRWRSTPVKFFWSDVDHRAATEQRAMPWPEAGAFMADLEAQEGVGALALRFAILTASRSGEVRGAT